MSNPAISLYELNSLIKNVLDGSLPEMFWIRAETSDVRVNQNGHCFLEFIEKDVNGRNLVAKARGMIWANTFSMLRPYFENTAGQEFTSGLKVLAKASVEFHELYGFSLTVHDIDPSYTLGDQALNRAAIIRQLEEDGVLTLNKELELPVPTNRIAIISSPTAAGYEDFLDQLNNNAYGFVFYTRLFPALMQGGRTESSIISALEQIYEYQDCFDAVVIIRGGGATSDLGSFDSYLLAACCAQFPLPVITGIGHERDDTVLDIVAHTRAKTPTAVAEFLIGNMAGTALELNETAHNIVSLVTQRLQDEAVQLSVLETKNTFVLKSWYREQNSILSSAKNTLTKSLQRFAKENPAEFYSIESAMKRIIQQRIKNQRTQLDMFEKHLTLASPENILKKGYTLTMKEGKVIKQSISMKKGDEITTVFWDGKIDSIVK
jgi:exodeoxyribonuclease VII large subunit